MSAVNITVEYMDNKQELHAQYFPVPAVPRVGETVVIENERHRVIHVVHRVWEERITICTERIK